MDEEKVLLLAEIDALHGKLIRSLADNVYLLEISLSALARGRVDVARERIEVAHNSLRDALINLQHRKN